MPHSVAILGMTSPDTVILDSLFDLAPGQPVTLRCQTSSANIFNKFSRDERPKCVPEPVQLLEIPYSVQGIVQGIEYGDVTDYLVLSGTGQAALLAQRKDCIRQVGYEQRVKVIHVPLKAIRQVIHH